MGRRKASALLPQPEPFKKFLLSLEKDSGPKGADNVSRAELDRMRIFLKQRYVGAIPVTSKIDNHGHVYDYFRVDDQPASRVFRLKPATPPPSGFLGIGR